MRAAVAAWGTLALLVAVWASGREELPKDAEVAPPEGATSVYALEGSTSVRVDGLNNGPPTDAARSAGDGWLSDVVAQLDFPDDVLADPAEESADSSTVERVEDPFDMGGRTSHTLGGPIFEEFLEMPTRVLRARPDQDLGGVAVAFSPGFDGIPTYPIVYLDWRADRFQVQQRLLRREPRVDRTYANVGEFSVRGRVGLLDEDYEAVWVPGPMSAHETYRVRISERLAGAGRDVDRLLVQVWPERPSRPEKIASARG